MGNLRQEIEKKTHFPKLLNKGYGFRGIQKFTHRDGFHNIKKVIFQVMHSPILH